MRTSSLSIFLAILAAAMLFNTEPIRAGGQDTTIDPPAVICGPPCPGDINGCWCGGFPNPKPNPFEQVVPEPGGGGGSECITDSTAEYNAVRNCIEDCSTCTFAGCCIGSGGQYFP